MADKKKISFPEIEAKWQKRWEKDKIFESDVDSKKPKYYALEMYPYPSGSGLHMGHAFNYSIGDIRARFKRMQGFNVLYPMGYDSFGLPAENAAIKAKSHPKIFTDAAIKNFIKQQKALGLSYDWTRLLMSHDPEYYRWNQHFFLQFLKNGLVYRKKSPVNWCPNCETVLANEQVHNGKCWRHTDTDVEIKPLEQWFIKTTNYAPELLDSVDSLDWPERIKVMQKNWIGRSEGAEIIFKVGKTDWPVFTTRPDTLMGVTFLVVSAQHPKLNELVTKEQKKEVETFLKRIKSTSEKDALDLEKDGVFTGSFALHPVTGEKIPIWAGNFVVADYGAGMVMAVPAHDQRDRDFAMKYNIPIKVVVEPVTGQPKENEEFRRSIVAIVENPKTNSVLSINWGQKLGWNLFIGGGVEEGEDEIKTAIREIQEETGYKNVELVCASEKIHHHYFAHSKNVAREIEALGLRFRLVNEERTNVKLDDAEKGKFTVEWIKKSDALSKIKDELHREVFKRLILGEAYAGAGILTNSGSFDGLGTEEAKTKIVSYLNEKKLGKQIVQYKLRDWLVSRQRYWGTPIPIVYCDSCGAVPVPEKDLPILLPTDVKFGSGNPMATSKSFVSASCPQCGGRARRETDTMDTFFDSSWYYLRFTDSTNKKVPFDKKKADYWMPVDFYIGGAEHANMHLIYARFFTKALRDLGYLKIDEPFKKLFNQGMLHKEGVVMSKSKGNVVSPEEVSDKYGIDTARLFLMSIASPDKDIEWSEDGIEGSSRFIQKILSFFEIIEKGKSSVKSEHYVNKAIRNVTKCFEEMKYNIAIIELRSLFDSLSEEKELSKENISNIIKLLSPLCPHLAEELWEQRGNKGFVSLAEWPTAEEDKINEKFELGEKAVENLSKDILNLINLVKQKGSSPSKIFVYTLPNEKELYNSESLSKRVSLPVRVFAVNDKDKHDPQGKSSKAKPNKPGIYLE